MIIMIFIMQSEQEISISLEQLNQFEAKEKGQISLNRFSVYLSANYKVAEKDNYVYQLTAKDTQRIPKIPIRRVGCQNCLSLNIACQNCHKCMKNSKICCRDINCIYEYQQYINSKQQRIYKICDCIGQLEPSNNIFEVDWRLLSLLIKVGSKQHIKYNYYLHFKVGILSVSQQEIGIDNDSSKISRIIFQDNFIADPDHQRGLALGQQNKMHLEGLLKQNIKTYIQRWQKWDSSNIQASCDQIIQNLLSIKGLEELKQKLLNQDKNKQHQFASGPSIRHSPTMINVTESTVKIDRNIFNDLSSAINENIIFFYHSRQQLLAIKNAKYQQKDPDKGIKTYEIIWSKGVQKIQKAVWFKDRKGDIFAIHGEFISIFKFHLKHKKFKQIILRQDKNLKRIVRAQSIVYISQSDRVYYFDASSFRLSFYFQLYRPHNSQQKQLSNCYSVNPLTTLQGRNFMRSAGKFYRSICIMQQIANQKDLSKNIQLVPVIYLLAQRKNEDSTPLSLYRIIIHQRYEPILQEINPTQRSFGESIHNIDFDNGIVATFKINKQTAICFQTSVNGNPVLIQGKIHQNEMNKSVDWSIHQFSISVYNQLSNKMKSHRKQVQTAIKLARKYIVLTQWENKISQYNQNCQNYAYVNDLLGYHTNNSAKYLAFLPVQNRFVQLILNIYQGDYLWKLYDSE